MSDPRQAQTRDLHSLSVYMPRCLSPSCPMRTSVERETAQGTPAFVR